MEVCLLHFLFPHSGLWLNLRLCSWLFAVGCHTGLGIVSGQKTSPMGDGCIELKGVSRASCLWGRDRRNENESPVSFSLPHLPYSASRWELVRRNSPGATFCGNCGKWAISGGGEEHRWPVSGLSVSLRLDTRPFWSGLCGGKILSSIRCAGGPHSVHPARWAARVLRVQVSFGNGLLPVKSCLSTAATQPLGFSGAPGPHKPAAAGWTLWIRLTGSLSQAAVLLCCIINMMTGRAGQHIGHTDASGQREGQGLVEQVSCRTYSILQACTLGLPGKSCLSLCCWWSVAGSLGVCRFISVLQICMGL